jgi:NAD(P)-dependent dehydrogenase (short-subunit alcohol dehydrogenase family)
VRVEASTFIVTGGASGLGEATVRHLHGLGAKVVISDQHRERGEELARELGCNALFCKTDVTKDEEGQACIGAAISQFDRVHGLISCAGVAAAEKLLGKEKPQPLENFARIVNVNLVGTFNVIRFAADAMRHNEPNAEGERGVIVNTASAAAFDGQIGQAAYAASKGGVVSLSLPLARELARFGIRVCAIAPGLFHTPMMASLPQEIRDSLAETVPFPPRLGRPSEFADLVATIVKNTMLNGETLRLDGAMRLAAR